jgi:UDP-3-O-[3-hydroxymyristoyl] glucosamine N-acyltransferase
MIQFRVFGKGGFAREFAHRFSGLKSVECELIDSREADPNDKRPAWIAIGDTATRETVYNTHKGIVITDPIICPGAQTTVNITWGKCVIINLNATIGHDCVIGDFVTISPGANISGNVTIGKRCYIGTGAAIIEGVTICDDVTIGAGGVVVKDITEPGTYVGCPVKKIK